MILFYFLHIFILNGLTIENIDQNYFNIYNIANVKDTIPELDTSILVITLDTSGLSKSTDIISGFYKVIDIDTFFDFYLIFIEDGTEINTIYSEKCLQIDRQNIEIGNTYYFEMICKNVLSNGYCMPLFPDVTYFGKYKGYDLGKLYITNQLCGLTLISKN
jgi:hypothetical protein